jgi:hypothetical protein
MNTSKRDLGAGFLWKAAFVEDCRKTEWEREIEHLYAAHEAELVEYATSIASDKEVARRAVQEVFFRYAVRLRDNPSFDGGYKWLASVLQYILVYRNRHP